MIVSSNRVPGQLLPVGARYWQNSGRPINALEVLAGKKPQPVAGLGNTAVDTGMTVLGGLIRGVAGYYVGTKLPEDTKDRVAAGALGALGAVFLGVPGLAIPAFVYGVPAPVKKKA